VTAYESGGGWRGRVKAILSRPYPERIYHLSHLYYRLYTNLLLKPGFKSMGKSCVIRKPLMIIGPDFMELGDGVSIREGVRLEVYRVAPERKPLLRIGSHTNIEQNVHIVCHNRIEIGENVSITSNCAIVDTTHPFDNVPDEVKVGESIADDDKTVEIGDGTFLGIGSIVLPGVRIGRKAIIGAHSVVASDVPDYGVVAGVPARFLRSVVRPNQETRSSGGTA